MVKARVSDVADDYLEAAVLKVEGLAPALVAITYDGYGFTIEDFEVSVFIVVDSSQLLHLCLFFGSSLDYITIFNCIVKDYTSVCFWFYYLIKIHNRFFCSDVLFSIAGVGRRCGSGWFSVCC